METVLMIINLKQLQWSFLTCACGGCGGALEGFSLWKMWGGCMTDGSFMSHSVWSLWELYRQLTCAACVVDFTLTLINAVLDSFL